MKNRETGTPLPVPVLCNLLILNDKKAEEITISCAFFVD